MQYPDTPPCTTPQLEHDGWAVLLNVHLRPAALKAPRLVVNEARLPLVWQEGTAGSAVGAARGSAGDPTQQSHQLAPVADAQAEGVWPAGYTVGSKLRLSIS